MNTFSRNIFPHRDWHAVASAPRAARRDRLQGPEYDEMGRPGLTHRSLQHVHFPGGGMWLNSATVTADLLHHIIDISARPVIGRTSFSDYYDTMSGVSGGAIVVSSILLPEQYGSLLPRFDHFGPIREQLATDSPSIFDPRKQDGFFASKTWRSFIGSQVDGWSSKFSTGDRIRHAINTAATDLDRTFAKADEVIDNLIYTSLPDDVLQTSLIRRSADWVADTKRNLVVQARNATMDGLKWLGDRAVTKTHFDHAQLSARLHERLKIEHPNGHMIDATMGDLLRPVVIPSITVTPTDNSYLRHIKPSNLETDVEILPPRFVQQFKTATHVADAATYSALQSPLFRTADGQTDGGTFYSAAVALSDTRLFRQPERYAVTILECNMSDFPDYVTPKSLERAFLPHAVAANLRIQSNSRRQADYMGMMLDPACSALVEFRRAARPTTTYPIRGPLHDEMEDFAWRYCRQTYGPALHSRIPAFDLLTQTATDHDTLRQFIAAGIQTATRMLPEAVQIAKRLITDGPLMDITTPEERREILAGIDVRFPPAQLRIMVQTRAHPDVNKQPLSHNDFVYFGESTTDLLWADRKSRALTTPEAPHFHAGQQVPS